MHSKLVYVLESLPGPCRSWNGRKTRSERCEAPTFSTIVEIRDRQNWYIHQDVAASVDDILNGSVPSTESRKRGLYFMTGPYMVSNKA